MPRPLAPHGGNDVVMTPPALATTIIQHYQPAGRILDPCRGTVRPCAFWREGWEWAEVLEGRDYLTHDWEDQHFDWVVTNPPWSQIRPFLARSMRLADNVVFLCLVNAFWMKARLRDMDAAGFGLREVLRVDTPAKPWPQTGFALGAVHVQRGYSGPMLISRA